MKMTLLKRARKVGKGSAIIAQRIKTIRAIHRKLQLNSSMKLSKMHDIGGCRAVLTFVPDVEKLVAVYEKATAKNPRRGGEFVRKYDYITSPKSTGYRGVHLVFKYRSESPKLSVYNGLRIEIQLRSRFQHAWATAVETVDYFTSQALKSNVGREDWKRFFALASSAFAVLERRPTVPGTPSGSELRDELSKLTDKIAMLEDFQKATEVIQNRGAHVFILELDSEKRTIKARGYEKQFRMQANIDYLALEKSIKAQPQIQAVLVSVDSFLALKKAYPNFFLDVSRFLALLKAFINM